MHTTSPGQTTIINESGLPTGQVVGFQLIKTATGTVALARTTAGVVERPAGSGNYVFIFIAPVEGDLYMLVADWTDGVLAPETTRIVDLQVSATVDPGSSGLGAVADYVKMNLGGETWKGLTGSVDYGASFVVRAIELVKRRAMTNPPLTVDEVNLDILILDYLGICASLELVTAARDYWGSQLISESVGNDSTEIVSYVNRAKLIDDLRDDLMRKLPAAQAAAIPLINNPILRTSTDGPAIDECDDCKVTPDPRDFPTERSFPGRSVFVDAAGFPHNIPARRSGVRL